MGQSFELQLSLKQGVLLHREPVIVRKGVGVHFVMRNFYRHERECVIVLTCCLLVVYVRLKSVSTKGTGLCLHAGEGAGNFTFNAMESSPSRGHGVGIIGCAISGCFAAHGA